LRALPGVDVGQVAYTIVLILVGEWMQRLVDIRSYGTCAGIAE
jgi:hypothetical protein